MLNEQSLNQSKGEVTRIGYKTAKSRFADLELPLAFNFELWEFPHHHELWADGELIYFKLGGKWVTPKGVGKVLRNLVQMIE